MKFLVDYKKYVGMVGCIIAIVGCFLPLASAYGVTAKYIDGDGKIFLITTVITAILIYLEKEKISLIPTILSALIFSVTVFNYLKSSGIHMEFGLILIILGLIAQIAVPFLNSNAKE